ncbi:hypothetical protein [Flammeovirga sp. EKP202]|uniref:hypothetical protein n=1 Tax=Flammeovirga sp. EKP202 TaxID=2770592 RepID=UPI00165FC52F|nr:hypothetical protein [Flammeovirga sp. EKP202]MBD0401227.1 hypothetical protein [Flammeovirga sp. EKP202]
MKKTITILAALVSLILSGCGSKMIITPDNQSITTLEQCSTVDNAGTRRVTIYQINENVTESDLNQTYLEESIEYASIYVTNGQNQEVQYEIAGITLLQLIENANLEIKDLNLDYFEWIDTPDGNRNIQLVIKAIHFEEEE